MRLLLVVALAVLSVVVVVLLVMAFRRNSPVDVEGWHRKLRILRDTAQPYAERPADEGLIIDTSDRNVRVVSAGAQDGDLAPGVDRDGECGAGEEDGLDAGASGDDPSAGGVGTKSAPAADTDTGGEDSPDADAGDSPATDHRGAGDPGPGTDDQRWTTDDHGPAGQSPSAGEQAVASVPDPRSGKRAGKREAPIALALAYVSQRLRGSWPLTLYPSLQGT